HVGRRKRFQDPVFPFDRMRSLEDRSARLLAQDHAVCAVIHEIGGIGLTSADPVQSERPVGSTESLHQKSVKRGRIKIHFVPRCRPPSAIGHAHALPPEGEEGSPAIFRSMNFWIFPVAVLGSSWKTKRRGILNPAR